MPGTLHYSPADIVAQLIVNLGHGVAIDEDPAIWPVYVAGEPDTPDNCITVYDTQSRDHGRSLVTGERQEHHGIQVRVRSEDHRQGFAKIRAIAVAFDQDVYLDGVTLEEYDYRIQAITRVGDPLCLGKDGADSRRSLFTLNCIVSVRELVGGALGGDSLVQEDDSYLLLEGGE